MKWSGLAVDGCRDTGIGGRFQLDYRTGIKIGRYFLVLMSLRIWRAVSPLSDAETRQERARQRSKINDSIDRIFDSVFFKSSNFYLF
jgi:hypothetical protein